MLKMYDVKAAIEEQTCLQAQKKWFAIYTRPRAEKKVSSKLIDLGIETFCPVQKTMRQWSDRRKLVEVPLFSSYVFVCISPIEYHKVLGVLGVVKFICADGKASVIPEQQIRNLKLLLSGESEFEHTAHRFREGQSVEVKFGSLTGLKGELVKIGNKKRVLIRIDHIDQNLLVNIPISYLQ